MCLFILCVLSTAINHLPDGYVIAHGDHPFFPEIRNNYSRLFYLWGNTCNGSGAPVGGDPATILQEGIFYALDLFSVSDTQKQNIKYFLFLFLSGISAYVAMGLFFRERIKPFARFVISVFYSFNGLTVLYVSYIGAYITAHDLHITLPLIWVLFTRGLIDKKYNYLVWSTVVVFLSVGGFQNPAFLLLLFLLLFTTVIFCWLTRRIGFKQVLLSFAVFISYIAVIGFYSFHLLYYLVNPPDALKTVDTVSLKAISEWIKGNARPIIDNFRFVYASVDNFPDVFPYDSLPKNLFVFLSFYPAFFIPLAIFLVKEKKYKSWLIFFLILYLIVLTGTAKHLILGKLALFIFTLPVLNVLRSWDKFMSLLPFIYAMFLAFTLISLQSFENRKLRRYLNMAILSVILIYPLPFFIGRFHVTFERNHLWGYKYSTMVKTPQYYKDIADYVNKDKSYYKILTMPYGGQIGMGWVLYPTWKYIGIDFTTLYFNNPVLSPIDDKFQFNYAKHIDENPIRGRDVFLNLLRSRGVKYLVVNRDTKHEEKYLHSFNHLFKGVEQDFIKLKDFGNLELYRLKEDKVLPVIYASNDIMLVADEKNTLIPYAETAYLDGYPALIFTEQNKNILMSLLDGQQKVFNNQILFANNNNFYNFTADLAKEDLFKLKEPSYLFYKDESDSSGVKVLGRKSFYIPKGGEYEITALVRPKREKVRAYGVKEDFKDGSNLDGWNFRIRGREKTEFQHLGDKRTERETIKDSRPVFMFSEGFYPPVSSNYLQMDGMWRWMVNDGKILIFNPLNVPVNADIDFSMTSFKEKREVRIFLNGDQIKSFSLPEPEEKVNERLLKEISGFTDISRAGGKPERVGLKAVSLRPGINEMLFKITPSAATVGKENKFFVSVALSDDFRVRFSTESENHTRHLYGYWNNQNDFEVKMEDNVLKFEDYYKGKNGEIGWVTRRFDGVDLFETPIFILKYSWSDNDVQTMDVGFRIDSDGDGVENIYFTRPLPDSISTMNRFEIDLFKEAWDVFPNTSMNKAFLMGVDIFPHRKGGVDMSRTIKKGVYTYQINGLHVTSEEASSVVFGREDFKRLKEIEEKATYTVSHDNNSLFVSLSLGGLKGSYASTEFTMPLRNETLREAPLITLPFQVTNKEVQNIIVWLGYDTSGDGKADRFLPLGVRVPLSGWRLITKDMKESMLLYEARLPENFPSKYTTEGMLFRNMVVLKDGEPLSSTWDNDFRIEKEQVQVDGKRVVINLPRDKDPDSYNYEVYYVPERCIIDSPRFPGFKEYAFEIEEAKEYLPVMDAVPVVMKITLEGKVSELIESEKEFSFSLMAPMYLYTLLPKLKDIERERNMPAVEIDDKVIGFDTEKIDGDKDSIRLERKSYLKEGEHILRTKEEGALEAYMVEIKPVNSQQSTVNRQEAPKIEFKKINPTRYIVDVKGAKEPFTLVFSESLHEGWKAYIRQRAEVRGQRSEEDQETTEPWSALWSAWKDSGNRIEIKDHFVVNGYANGWVVPAIQESGVRSHKSEERRDFQVVLEYKPQRLFEVGLLISGTTLLGCIGYLWYGIVRRRGKND